MTMTVQVCSLCAVIALAASTIDEAVPPTAPPSAAPAGRATAPSADDAALDKLRADAGALRPFGRSDLARAWLDATAALPAIAPRVVWRSKDRSRAMTDAAYEALPQEEREQYVKRECDSR